MLLWVCSHQASWKVCLVGRAVDEQTKGREFVSHCGQANLSARPVWTHSEQHHKSDHFQKHSVRSCIINPFLTQSNELCKSSDHFLKRSPPHVWFLGLFFKVVTTSLDSIQPFKTTCSLVTKVCQCQTFIIDGTKKGFLCNYIVILCVDVIISRSNIFSQSILSIFSWAYKSIKLFQEIDTR
jgi:hypothetical protein